MFNAGISSRCRVQASGKGGQKAPQQRGVGGQVLRFCSINARMSSGGTPASFGRRSKFCVAGLPFARYRLVERNALRSECFYLRFVVRNFRIYFCLFLFLGTECASTNLVGVLGLRMFVLRVLGCHVNRFCAPADNYI